MSNPLENLIAGKIIDGVLAEVKKANIVELLKNEIHGLLIDSDGDGKTQLQNALDEVHQAEAHLQKAAQIVIAAKNAK